MRRRLAWCVLLYFGLCAALAGRLFVLTMVPDWVWGQARQRGWLGKSRVQVAFSQFALRSDGDGRGRVLYRDGGVWPPRSSTVVGHIGLPDRWPAPNRSVQEQGRSGLEETFDRLLIGHPGYRGNLRDATGQVVGGTDYRIPPRPGYDVRTTLDPRWQRAAAGALANQGVRDGAVVVLDVATHQVLAIAGTDTGRASDWTALRPATPGSIYKLVTAAAALETHRVRWSQPFVCDGEAHVTGVRMRCWRPHGRLTFAAALAESCDATFVAVAAEIGIHPLQALSARLGLLDSPVQEVDGRPVLSVASAGIVLRPHEGGPSPGVVANTAIGQEDVRISPLVAANLACTVAAGGRYRPARLVLDVERNRLPVRWFGTAEHRALSPLTANLLQQGMRLAVVDPAGTAHALCDAPVPVAVKTGTAELSGTGRVNAWMVGFAPYQHPRIAFAVYVGRAAQGRGHEQVVQATQQLLRVLGGR